MKLSRALLLPLLVLVSSAAFGCSGSDTSSFSAGGNSSTGGSGSGGETANGGTTASGGASTGGTGGSTQTTTGGTGGTTTTTTPMDVLDPSKDGPYQTTTKDGNAMSGNGSVPIHAVYPTSGPESGPYPVIVIGHGFQLPVTQYTKYAERLATFGYVALTADFAAGFGGPDNPGNAAALIAGLDWAKTNLAGVANTDLAGITGHSLGGKVGLLAATKDPRFKASITLDPVDSGGFGGCNPPGCVDVSDLMSSLNIPTGFLGETTDAMAAGFGQACAPAADNFLTFYANTNSPSLAVTIKGANHMSFIDDVAGCGFTCNLCNMATLDNATVNGMSRAYVVAFYERYLRNNTGYDTYLTGAKAQELYVTPGTATIQSK